MKKVCSMLLLLLPLTGFIGCSNAADTDQNVGAGRPAAASREVVPGIPAKDTVTLVDLGAKTCIPCKMMAPILEELKADYQGRAEVIFIDVHERPEMSKPFAVMAIPTQILYDRQGKEVFRHVGFLDKQGLKENIDHVLEAK